MIFPKTESARLAKQLKKRRRRRALAILLVVALAMATLTGAVAYMYNELFGNMGTEFNTPPNRAFDFEIPEETYDPDFESLYDITDAANLRDFLRQWWYSGNEEGVVMYHPDVLNILLLGANDSTNLSNTMMLVSINQRTRMITLLSFLRDSYTYLNINERQMYHRLNNAFAMGGPEGAMEAIERLFKIRVDNYVAMNMSAFPRLIDALGGVRVDVTEAEARFINRTAPSMQGNFPAGNNVQLNGRQALVFTRIRRLDSDMARTNRQQLVIESLIRSARIASVRQLYNALDVALPFVITDFSRTDMMRMLPTARSWLNFGMTNMHVPIVAEGPYQSAFPGTIHRTYFFITDFPLAAQQAQIALYGESNINLEAGRDAYIARLFASAAQTSQVRQQQQQQTTQSPQQTLPEAHDPGDEHQPDPPNNEPTEPGNVWEDILGGLFGRPTEPPPEQPAPPPEQDQAPETPDSPDDTQ